MNPFIYGEYVKEMSFINRVQELKEFTRDLLDSQKIFLISPRRYGKTSLLRRVKENLEKKRIKVVYVDLFKCASIEQLVAALTKELSKFEAVSFEKAFKFIKNIIASLRPIVSMGKEGELSIQIDAIPRKQETYTILEDLLAYAQSYADKKKTKVVIILDEFQEILKFGGVELEKYLRAVVQTQRRVGYVFCGSKKDILEEMVTKRSRAFFGIGPVVHLDKIDEKIWSTHIEEMFKKGGYKMEHGAANCIIKKARGIPYYIQFLSHELWDNFTGEKVIKTDYIEGTIKTIVMRNTPSYENMWENLTGVQQRMLEAIAIGDIENTITNDILIRHQIGSRAAAVKTIDLLKKKDIIEKDMDNYIFSDVWFCEWIKNYILGMETTAEYGRGRQDKAEWGRVRQGGAEKGRGRQDKAEWGRVRQGGAEKGRGRQRKAERGK